MITTKNPESNYLCQIIRLPELRKHSNADRLQCMNWQGNNIITGLMAREGDLYVYFPAESRLNTEYLSFSNSFRDSELNADKTKKGLFELNARIKNVKLRGENSSGYIVPISDIEAWATSKGLRVNLSDFIGREFDSIGDLLLCEKYVNVQAQQRENRESRQRNNKREKRFNKIIEDQFRFHVAKTDHLGKHIHEIHPDDTILITYKIHGAAASVNHILCKKKLSWLERLLKRFGINIVDSEYAIVWASRSVIKNKYGDDNQGPGFYAVDVWGDAAKTIGPCLPKGVSVYFEVAGFLSTGAFIQKGYDYSCLPNQHRNFIYRVTFTNVDGKMIELTWDQVKVFCRDHGLETVPELYYGKAKDLFPTLDVNNHWNQEFLLKLSDKFLEKDCYISRQKVPEEGIVLSICRGGEFVPWKFKSNRFKIRESQEIDTGEVDIETQESCCDRTIL